MTRSIEKGGARPNHSSWGTRMTRFQPAAAWPGSGSTVRPTAQWFAAVLSVDSVATPSSSTSGASDWRRGRPYSRHVSRDILDGVLEDQRAPNRGGRRRVHGRWYGKAAIAGP